MGSMNKKGKNRFNFVSQEEVDKVSINLKDKGKSISSNEAFKDVKINDLNKKISSDDAFKDVKINYLNKKICSNDAFKDVHVSSPKKKNSDEAITDLYSFTLSNTSIDGDIYHFNFDEEELFLPFDADNKEGEGMELENIKNDEKFSNEIETNLSNHEVDKNEKIVDIEILDDMFDKIEKSDDSKEINIQQDSEDMEEVDASQNDENLEEEPNTSEDDREDINEARNIDEVEESDTNKYDSEDNKDFSCGKRIFMYIILVIVLGIGLAFFIYQVFKYRALKDVNFIENTNVTYSVCDKGFNGKTTCLNDDISYNSEVIGKIMVNYDYDASFDEKISNNYTYKVVAATKIVDQLDKDKVLYENEDLLFSKNISVKKDDLLEFNSNVEVNFQKYYNSVLEYLKKYNLNAVGDLNVELYLDDSKESRNVASIELPLSGNTFRITKKLTNNASNSILIKTTSWDKTNSLYAVISVILICAIILLVINIFKLLFAVRTNRNEYQIRLSSILREYDRLIVIARDGYESNVSKEVIDVNSFDDLLSIRSSLEKPIIFSQVNPKKCEFIVEDDKKLYKYVLKGSNL